MEHAIRLLAMLVFSAVILNIFGVINLHMDETVSIPLNYIWGLLAGAVLVAGFFVIRLIVRRHRVDNSGDSESGDSERHFP